MSCQNNAPPLALPNTNVRVATNNGTPIHRGIAINVGQPPQAISLRPFITTPHVWVLNSTNCNNGTDASLVAELGGVFDPALSTTYWQVPMSQWNATWTGFTSLSPWERANRYLFFYDNLWFSSTSKQVVGFPFLAGRILTNYASALGLGWPSQFTTSLVADNIIPSSTWGAWLGSQSLTNPVDGEFIFGGYDKGRIAGPMWRWNATAACPTCTSVVAMTYQTSNGSQSLLTNTTKSFSIMLDPGAPSIGIPNDIFARFAQVTGGVPPGANNTALQFPSSMQSKLGNITITLAGGYNTTIPSSELFLPPRAYNSSGVLVPTNSSVLWTTVVEQTSPARMLWGMPFLTMNYFMMEPDVALFHLAPAAQGLAKSRNVVTRCGGADNPGVKKNGTVVQSFGSMVVAASGKKSMTKSVVIGVVCGVVTFVLVGVALVVLIRWYRKRNRNGSERWEVKRGLIEKRSVNGGVDAVLSSSRQPRFVAMRRKQGDGVIVPLMVEKGGGR